MKHERGKAIRLGLLWQCLKEGGHYKDLKVGDGIILKWNLDLSYMQ
jgi:hypothetical protein